MKARVQSDRRGAALLELALVLPVLMLLLMGVLDYGWAFYRNGQITNAAREAARIAVLPDSTESDVTARIVARMSQLGLTLAEDYTVDVSDVTVDVGEPVTVWINVPYANVRLIGFVPGPTQLRGHAVMSKEGP